MVSRALNKIMNANKMKTQIELLATNMRTNDRRRDSERHNIFDCVAFTNAITQLIFHFNLTNSCTQSNRSLAALCSAKGTNQFDQNVINT